MAPTVQGGGRIGLLLQHAAVIVLLVSTFLDVTHATQWVVGDDAKWSYLHSDSVGSFYNDWAASKTFSTGDNLLFEYDNTTHSVLQLATGSDFLACNLKASIAKWTTGSDSVFISKAGTYYYVCGAPSHCEQGMRVSITATGDYVAPPPGAGNGTTAQAPSASHAPSSPTARHSGAVTLIVAIASLAATLAVCV